MGGGGKLHCEPRMNGAGLRWREEGGKEWRERVKKRSEVKEGKDGRESLFT